MFEFFKMLFEWYMDNLNYFTIFILMAIESTFLPLPSEVVIPFAAYRAAQGDLSFWGVILFGTLGALAGSLFNYFLSRTLGRIIIYKLADTKFAHFFLVTREKVEEAENYFIKNGKSSTFIGRLIPGIRHLISIPAGLARMKLKDFVLYTVLGAMLWNVILAVVGYFFHAYQEQIFHYLTYILIILGAGFIAYLIFKALPKKKK
jgi:membrane protein DedA with SNARE-associated domain